MIKKNRFSLDQKINAQLKRVGIAHERFRNECNAFFDEISELTLLINDITEQKRRSCNRLYQRIKPMCREAEKSFSLAMHYLFENQPYAAYYEFKVVQQNMTALMALLDKDITS
ncbi:MULTISPECIES: hypothetical protein [unclassified Arsenophonus]|uniref:hypothetical protein n=1 Tax=unclassified Arsenophonus TaxID=2627083 RepID=UPI002856E32E|nr:hypothetical protein [Arsenophonus sp.]MDR5610763.1 hypothetical protein [Arsenophonus sp.]MDR5615185.1 hypothetical protein [Arsenophonus sp.]